MALLPPHREEAEELAEQEAHDPDHIGADTGVLGGAAVGRRL